MSGYADDCEAPDSYATPERTPQPRAALGMGMADRGRPATTLEQARLERYRHSPMGRPGKESITETLQRQMHSLEGLRSGGKRSTYVRTTSPSVHSMHSGQAGCGGRAHPHAVDRTPGGDRTRGAALPEPHRTPSATPTGDRGAPADRWEQERAGDLEVQLEAMHTQLANKDEKLRTLKECLRAESEATAALQAELLGLIQAAGGEGGGSPPRAPAPAAELDAAGRAQSELDIILQSERRIATDAEHRLQEAEAASKMTEDALHLEVQALRGRYNALRHDGPQAAQESIPAQQVEKLDDIRSQMLQKLQKVTQDMETQFGEERTKLENRIEYLTRMNDRKDGEIDSQKNRKAEINNLIGQARANHKALMQGLQSKYEHERRETLQHESNAAKHERELRLKSDECEKLRERLRKLGNTSQKAAATPAKKRPAGSPYVGSRSTAASRASTSTLARTPGRFR